MSTARDIGSQDSGTLVPDLVPARDWRAKVVPISSAFSVPCEYVTYAPSGREWKKLKVPLKVDIETGEDVGFLAFAPALDLGGVGESIQAAIIDLLSTAVSLIADFEGTPPEELDSSAVAALQRLRTIFG